MNDGVELFETEIELPDRGLDDVAATLVGFEERFARLGTALGMLLDRDSVEAWAAERHPEAPHLTTVLAQRYPLVIFHGDVGTGKTAFAESAADRLCRSPRREGTLMKLSTRVRGVGKVGELSDLLNRAFAAVEKVLGRERVAVLVIDEADSLAANRAGGQSHHEDKVGVNTLIQKIDDVRRHRGRLLVFLCTNRLDAVDPALLRRAGHVEEFRRPDDEDREALLRHDLEGTGVSDAEIVEIVGLTGQKGPTPGFTFSDLRTRLIPEAVGAAFPDRGLTGADLVDAARRLEPSPRFEEGG